MSALVTISAAKSHLRVTSDDLDGDIYAKAEQASAIVLEYLKNRSNVIGSISAANPTVITTETPHSLTSGASYTIAGTTTTPTVNGVRVVTVTGSTTFTVPVTVTSGQDSAAGTVGTPVWTEATVPGPVQAAVLLTLEDLHEHRLINWEELRLRLMRSRDPALA